VSNQHDGAVEAADQGGQRAGVNGDTAQPGQAITRWPSAASGSMTPVQLDESA
jgi:hypothetical protein